MNELTFHPVDSAASATHLSALFDEVWGGHHLVAPELVRAIAYSGGYATLARLSGITVGGSLAWIGVDDDAPILHSHATCVLDAHRDHGVGLALKHHQRAWALNRGVGEIRWSFDPLVRRNAWFNVVSLGARVIAYERDFYGPMVDEMNHTGPSDRLIVSWSTVEERISGPITAAPGDVVVGTPDDIMALRQRSPASALAWRMRVRDAIAPAIEAGGHVRGVDRDVSYVIAPG